MSTVWDAVTGWFASVFSGNRVQRADFESLAALHGKDVESLLAREERTARRLAEHIAASDKDHAALRAEMDTVHHELRNCRDQHADCERKTRRLEEEGAARQAEIDGLKRQNAGQQAQLDTLKRAVQ